MKVIRKAASASMIPLVLLLAGCGGGGGVNSTGGGGGNASSYTKFDDLTGDQTFQTAGVTTLQAGAIPGYMYNRPFGQGMTARYFVSSDQVEIQNNGQTFSFGAADYSAQHSNAQVDVFIKPDGTVLTVGVPQVNGVNLSYVRLGGLGYYETGWRWQELAVFGVSTRPGDMPKSGTASYTTTLTGAIADDPSGFYDMNGQGNATFSADFGAGTVQTSIAMRGKHINSGNVMDFGTVQGTGTIDSASAGFSGTFSTGAGAFSGGFFGPKASEMGYGFAVTVNSTTVYGHVAGKK